MDTFSEYDKMVDKLSQEGLLSAPVVRNELVIIKKEKLSNTFRIDPNRHSKISSVFQPKEMDNSAGFQDYQLTFRVMEFTDGGIVMELAWQQVWMFALVMRQSFYLRFLMCLSAFGMMRVRKLKVIAIFNTGMPEYDETYSFIPLSIAQFFSGYTDEIDYIEVKTVLF